MDFNSCWVLLFIKAPSSAWESDTRSLRDRRWIHPLSGYTATHSFTVFLESFQWSILMALIGKPSTSPQTTSYTSTFYFILSVGGQHTSNAQKPNDELLIIMTPQTTRLVPRWCSCLNLTIISSVRDFASRRLWVCCSPESTWWEGQPRGWCWSERPRPGPQAWSLGDEDGDGDGLWCVCVWRGGDCSTILA